MKNKELIKELNNYNLNAEVQLINSEKICLSYICKDENNNLLSKENTSLIFIEAKSICPMCTSEYMNGDDIWCSFYDCACRDVEECEQFEEFDDI